MWIIYGHINLNKKSKHTSNMFDCKERPAYVPSDNLPNNRIEEHKPDVFDFCKTFCP